MAERIPVWINFRQRLTERLARVRALMPSSAEKDQTAPLPADTEDTLRDKLAAASVVALEIQSGGGGAVTSVAGKVGAVTLVPADIVGLVDDLDDRVPTSTTVNGQPLTGDVTIVNISGNSGTSGVADLAVALQTGRTIAQTGDVVWTSPAFDGSGNVTNPATIQPGAVTFAKQALLSNASVLVGRGAGAGSGSPQEITLGTNLSMTGTVLNATGGGGGSGDVVGPASSVDGTFAVFDGVTGKLLKEAANIRFVGGQLVSAVQFTFINGFTRSINFQNASDDTKSILLAGAPTADRTQGLQDADGVIALLSDIPATGSLVVGPASATDNAIARYDLATGKLIQDSPATISDAGKITAESFALTASGINAQTGISYTLLATDNGKIVTLSNAAAITLTVPSGLGAAFSCAIVQLGAGQVTVTPSGTTVSNFDTHTKTAGQYAAATLLATSANNFILGGRTTA